MTDGNLRWIEPYIEIEDGIWLISVVKQVLKFNQHPTPFCDCCQLSRVFVDLCKASPEKYKCWSILEERKKELTQVTLCMYNTMCDTKKAKRLG